MTFTVGTACVLLSICRGAPQGETGSDINKAVDSVFRLWDNPASPGCALGVIRGGRLIYSRGYGMANLEHNVPISPQTAFNIGSISKQFTAACLILLAQRHKLSLDDDVRQYIPELPDYGKRITLRQLLNHTSGLRDYLTLLYFSGVRVEDLESSQDAMEMILRQRSLNSDPGKEWLYSNTGYFLASVIVKRVSGESLPEFARQQIFLPLGMTHTIWETDPKDIILNSAQGYSPRIGGGFQSDVSGWALAGDGGICTTVEDLLRWDNNFYQPTVGGAEMIGQLTTPGELSSGKKLDYGLGLFVGKYRGLNVVRHEGEWAGYRAEMLRFPDQHFSVICLCNLSSMIPVRLAQQVAELYLSHEMTTSPLPFQPSVSSRLTGDNAAPYVGYYRNPDDETVRRITLSNGVLMYGRVPGAETALAAVGRESFRMLGVPARVVVGFSGNPGEHETRMEVCVDSEKPLVFQFFHPITLTREEEKEYVGTYYSDELDVRYGIVLGDSGLVVRIRRFDDLPLTPTIRDIFKYQDYRSFVFSRDGEHRIKGFALSTIRARNIFFQKIILPASEKLKG